jgi:putative transposase
MYSREHPDFITITCLNWKHLLQDDHVKEIIIGSLDFLYREKRIVVYAFVIMPNHLHMVWQMIGNHKREDVQRDFLKYTAQRILRHIKTSNPDMLRELFVGAKDRKYQVWERNSLSIPLWSPKVLWQKINYIHQNPVRAQLCNLPFEYKYSSAGFYKFNINEWPFVTSVWDLK